ncbi:MAG: hypothetical protein ACJ76N_09395 [Thermoanaerobaculia bacterium]
MPCAAPPTVSISGSSFVGLAGTTCRTYTYTANVSGGVPGYSYQWYFDGSPAGTGSTYSHRWCGFNTDDSYIDTISVTVTDSASQSGSASLDVDIETTSTGGCYAAAAPNDPNKYVPICPY